jgi:hypothetical protein
MRRRFVASILYELPFGKGKPYLSDSVAGVVLGGWQLGSILTFADGTPTEVGGLGDFSNIGVDNNRPDATGISPFENAGTAGAFWNVAAFSVADPTLPYRSGTSPRNALLRPGVRNWDFTLSRDIRIMEGHSLQFRFEGFNFSNHPNWNAPSADVRRPTTFGVVTTARTMRELQLGLKYVF